MNPKCPSREELKRFLDIDQISLESKALQTHLNSCVDCQTALEELTASDWIPASDSQRVEIFEPQLQKLAAMMHSAPLASHESRSEPTHALGVPDENAPLGRMREFRILTRLAGGAQGTMYLAFDEKLHRKVAIKVLNQGLLDEESNKKRFEREARLAASLNDEKIVRVHQVCQEPDLPPFIVMEYVAGRSLKQCMEGGRPTIDEAVRWVHDAAMGLAAAHHAGLIHRDIKPSNLMLDESSGLTRLTDFGLALEQADANRMTQAGVLAGTPAYMSPEQLSRPETIDFRSDIYSLGVVLYELMAGEVPFRGTLRMTLLQVAHHEPRSPRQFNDQIPADLETIVLRAMARDPNKRFTSAKEFAAELDRWRQGLPILSRPTGRIEKFRRWCRRRPAVAALSASTLGLMLTLATVLLVSYFRLEQSARQKQRDAEAAAKERDAALDVLSQLVFKLQNQFEQEIFDVDEIQKNSLQIAIDGLSRLKELTDQEQFPEALTAEAFRKMGDTLARLDRINAARDCMVRAERGFRELQSRPENRQQALAGIVETLWSRHDLEIDSGSQSEELTSFLTKATKAARELHELAPTRTSGLLLAQSLLHEVQSEFGSDPDVRIPLVLNERLAEIHRLINLKDDDLRSPDEAETVRLWVETVMLESEYLLEASDHAIASKLLNDAIQRLRKHGKPQDSLSSVVSHLLTLEYMLHTLSLDGDLNDQAEASLGRIRQELDRLKKLVAVDPSLLKVGMVSLQELADRFEENSDEEGRLFFLDHLRDLLDRHLARISEDEQTRLQRAFCNSEIAEGKFLLDYPNREVRKSFLDAISEYRELATRTFFDEEHWYDYCSVLLATAEFEQQTGKREFNSFVNEARRLRNKLSSEFEFPTEIIEQIDERLKDLTSQGPTDRPPTDRPD